MTFSQPPSQLIRQRYSCRKYRKTPISEEACRALADFITRLPAGPFNAPNRFQLVVATSQDHTALRGLGTYGFIQNAPGFIIGATRGAEKDLEDFGYRMEEIILHATGLGLGTCWLGGTFTRSSFSRKIAAVNGEIIPAVCAVGVSSLELSDAQIDLTRDRLGWDDLFFERIFGAPLMVECAGAYATPIEMVRLAPSASNKQPWRIVMQDNCWHFYIRRTKGYREMAVSRFTGIADMQRIDLGIAMAHFELAAIDAGLTGQWQVSEPDLIKPDGLTEYAVSWAPAREGN